jgi:hypothetical protein
MTHHPHVHMIVPGGGLSSDGSEWITCRKNFFLSVRVLSRLYRRLILEGLAKLLDAGKLHFFGEHSGLIERNNFDDFLKPLRQIDWVVYAKEPFAGPKAVLAYLSRYTHRIAISNSRLIRFDERSVTFRVKDYRLKGAGRHTTMTLATAEFIRRFLIHVLPRGQHRIRHYGFFGNGNRAANIAWIRRFLGVKTPDHSRDDDNSRGNSDEPPRVLALPCPCCGGQLITVEIIAPAQHSRAPPKPKKGRSMTCAPHITSNTLSRRLSLLRTHRHARIKRSTPLKWITPTRHHANRKNADKADLALSPTGHLQRVRQVISEANPPTKSP